MTSVTLPLTCPNINNKREHWAARAKRTKAHRNAARLALGRPQPHRGWLTLGGKVVVTLTRIAPRELDDDGNVASLKAVRDGVADALGIDDRDPRLAFVYGQEKGPVAVRIDLQSVMAADQSVPF